MDCFRDRDWVMCLAIQPRRWTVVFFYLVPDNFATGGDRELVVIELSTCCARQYRSAALVGKIFYLRQDAVASTGAAVRVVKVEATVIPEHVLGRVTGPPWG